MNILIPIIILFIFFIIQVPIGIALGVAGAIGILINSDLTTLLAVFTIEPYTTTANFAFLAVPMFILMAEFINRGKIVKSLFNFAQKCMGSLPGSLVLATIAANAMLGALCGSSTAAAAAMTKSCLGEMVSRKYSKRFAAGAIAASGTFSIMIPPSIPLIVYGVWTQTSVGKMLMAGIIPGILTAILYSVVALVWVRFRPFDAPQLQTYTFREKFIALKGIWPGLILVLLIFGGMYTGIFTPTEAGALGATGALLLSLLRKLMNVKGFNDSLTSAVGTSVMILIIMIGANIFSRFLALSGITGLISDSLAHTNLSPATVIFLVVVPLFFVAGMFMSMLPSLLLVLPIVFPVVKDLGYNPIWFGIFVTKLGEIALVTPPVCMNVFTVAGSSDGLVNFNEVLSGALPFLAADFIVLVLLVWFPKIALFLPSLM